MENSMAKIAAALVKAQQAFGPALKTSSNPHFKSRYADLAACVEAVMDGLNSNGIALIQKTHQCDSGVMVETVFVHESGETLSNGVLHVPASKQDPQGYGSALTYARRYSLMAACGIAPEDDDGNAASRKPPQAFNLQAAQKDVAAAKTVDELGKVWATHGAIATAAKDRDGYASLKALCADRKAALEAA
jgi:hypothetical protein